MTRNQILAIAGLWLMTTLVPLAASAQVRVIEVLADKDSRYKIAGEKEPEVILKAGEQAMFRVTAKKGKSWNRDGSVHGFTLLRAGPYESDRLEPVLRPGMQEFQLTAPADPGEYEIVCTVICSEEHEGMHMKVTVLP